MINCKVLSKSVLIILCLMSCAFAQFPRDKASIDSLRGLNGIAVNVSLSSANAFPQDPTEREIQESVEQSLRTAGINVVPKQSIDADNLPMLIVSLALSNDDIFYYHLSINLRLRQEVLLKANPELKMTAATWESSMSMFGGGRDKREFVAAIVDQFICDFRAANPSTRGPMPPCRQDIFSVFRDRLDEPYKRPSGMRKMDEDIIRAAALVEIEKIKLLLDQGADVEAQDPAGWTPLLYAVRSYNSAADQNVVVQMLLDRGANPNVTMNGRWTPLMLAVQRRNVVLVQALLDHGASINTSTREGFTALMAASVLGFPDLVTLLMRSGANINARTQDGKTALSFALSNRNRISPQDRQASETESYKNITEREVALLEKARSQHDEVVRFLKSAGAKP